MIRSRDGDFYGEMSEWLKEPVLKTGGANNARGFESHSLRHCSFCWEMRTDPEMKYAEVPKWPKGLPC